jgi:hypothetical protein
MPYSAAIFAGPEGVPGNRRWTIINTLVKMLCVDTSTFPGTEIILTCSGTMVMDNLNGSIASHSVTAPPTSPIVVVGPAADGVRPTSERDPTSTETNCTWTDPVPDGPFHTNLGVFQSFMLSNPVDASTAKLGAETLALSVDLTTFVKGQAYQIRYPEDTNLSFFQGPASGDWPIAAWEAVTGTQEWVPCNNSYPIIADATIHYVPPAVAITVLGPYGPGIGIQNSEASWVGDVFYNVFINLITGMNPGQENCLQLLYDPGANALGFTNNCQQQFTDGSGNLLILWPALDVDPTDTVVESFGQINPYLNAHRSVSPDGCPCVVNI